MVINEDILNMNMFQCSSVPGCGVPNSPDKFVPNSVNERNIRSLLILHNNIS